MRTCVQIVELVTDYLEGALSAAEHSDVEVHLRSCGYCLRYVAQIQATVKALGQLPASGLEEERVELVRRFHR